jgi:hypothetical protein
METSTVRILSPIVSTLVVFILVGCGSTATRSPAQPAVAATTLGAGYVSSTTPVNGTTLHYVRGGHGPAIILLHGYPEDWYVFHIGSRERTARSRPLSHVAPC